MLSIIGAGGKARGAASQAGGQGGSSTALETAAAALSSGQSASFTAPTISNFGISWQCCPFYYDSTRKEAHFMTKAQNGGAAGHQIYREATDDFYTPTIFAHPASGEPGNVGHIWSTGFYADAEARYVYHPYGDTKLRIYTRSTDAWTVTSDNTRIGNSGSSAPGVSCAIHPNLYGAGDWGILCYTKAGIYAWRASTDTWADVIHVGVFDNGPYSDHATGASVYLPTSDTLVFGTGDVNEDTPPRYPLVGFGAGSSGSLGTGPTDLGDPPIEVAGGTSTAYGKLVADPRNADNLMILHGFAGTVYTSSDGGDTFSEAAISHPFVTQFVPNNSGEWSCCSIPEYGIIWGLCDQSASGSVQSRIWKP